VGDLRAGPLEIDGSTGEGGGQLLRSAVALAAVTGTAVRIVRIRARRAKPGLAPQHLTAVRAVAAMCDAHVEGLAQGSQQIVFAPGTVRGGEHRFEVGTAGSVTLVLQALLPVMVMAPSVTRVAIAGGTDVPAAPPLDYLREVLLPLLARVGVDARVECLRRGYYPRGGGEITCTLRRAALRPVELTAPGPLASIDAFTHVGNLPEHIAQRMAAAAAARLREVAELRVHASVLGPDAAQGAGGAIVLRARTGASVLGAARVAERGVSAERLGDEAGSELLACLASGAALDVHAADQLAIHLALAGPGSHFTVRTLTAHASTAFWLIERFLPVRFEAHEEATRVAVRVLAR